MATGFRSADFDPSMINACFLPLDHPVLLYEPARKNQRKEFSKCTWMGIECNAWRWRHGPFCGITAMQKLRECKWQEQREKLLRKKR